MTRVYRWLQALMALYGLAAPISDFRRRKPAVEIGHPDRGGRWT